MNPVEMTRLLQAREERYGDFELNAILSQRLKTLLRKTANWNSLPDILKEALEMDMHKLSRILCGEYKYLDSWVDRIGYIQRAVEYIEQTQFVSSKEENKND
jgi:hypothetical protein